MTLPGYSCPLKVLVKLPERSVAIATAPFNPLLDCVPMPKIMEPAKGVAPVAITCGRTTDKPLLSWGNIHTGFCSCAARAVEAMVQTDEVQLQYAGIGLSLLHHSPQSWRKRPTPSIPLKPSWLTSGAEKR